MNSNVNVLQNDELNESKNSESLQNDSAKVKGLINLPKHVAFIPDGNRRWAKLHHLKTTSGHEQGFNRVNEIVYKAIELGIEYFTVYVFSTENWNRPRIEVEQLIDLIICVIDRYTDKYKKDGIKIRVFGDLSKFSPKLQSIIQKTQEETKFCTKFNLSLCLNYGARKEIVMACRHIAQDVVAGNIDINNITDKVFDEYLYTNEVPDPDLVIRTSGEFRISNFLLWQLAYSEFIFEDKSLPDYTVEDFCNSLMTYSERERRYGK